MVLGVIFITGAGYVFARFKFKGKKAGLMGILVLQVFPSFMGIIAMFVLFQTFGLLGKPTYLTILYVGGSIPGNIWLIKGYLSQIPKDLDESAMLDGASKWQIFFKIILPLAVPILSFVAVGQFMAPWMDYILPRLLLDVQINPEIEVSKQWTLAVGLFSLISNPRSSSYTTFAAGALIVAVPITVLYMIFQRYLIEGITAGATKG
jgi:arabinogalactan oligomer/maltooligosaccharide transport system permease protein